MDRKELYKEITSLGLQDEVKARYGKNYTQCSNADLQKVVDEVKISLAKSCDCAFSRLVEILAKKKILLKSEVDTIMGA